MVVPLTLGMSALSSNTTCPITVSDTPRIDAVVHVLEIADAMWSSASVQPKTAPACSASTRLTSSRQRNLTAKRDAAGRGPTARPQGAPRPTTGSAPCSLGP